MHLTDDLSDPTKSQIPTNAPTETTIQPDGYLLIWADGETGQGPLHANFSLSAGGEEVGLFSKTGVLVDGIVFTAQADDESYGRSPNGSSTWAQFGIGATTPGSSNDGEAADIDSSLERVVNCLYQVYLTDSLFDPADDWAPGTQPLYNIIMTNSERGRIQDIGNGNDPPGSEDDSDTDAQMNATFISVDGIDTKLRYNCGIRNRGHGTRDDPPNNFRVNFRQDDSWKDVTAINLNDQHSHIQYFGHMLFKLAGLPSEDPLAVQLRINGVNHAADYHSLTQGSYVHLEAYDTDWAGNHFPDDPDGNVYSAVSHTKTADLIELYYDGPGTLDMAGMSITDNSGDPLKYVFEPGTTIAAGEYKVLVADPYSAVPGHLNFALTSLGDEVYLYDAGENVIDSVEFGMQWRYWSIGRLGDDEWHLNVPTLGLPNVKQPLGDPAGLKINEWLTNGDILFVDDFIELYNPSPYPVSLSDLYLSDNITQPLKDSLGPLSFIEPNGYAVYRADDSDNAGHVGFKLNSTKGIISLADDQGNVIDRIVYRPQTTDYSQGRNPDGAGTLEFFALPTPWLANAASESEPTILELVADDADVLYKVPTDDTDEDTWMQPGHSTSGWQSNAGVLGFGDVFTGGVGSSQWQAFNDCHIVPLNGTDSNVTRYTLHEDDTGSTSGTLKDYATGIQTGMPTVTFTATGTVYTSDSDGAGGAPDSGTDAHNYFFNSPTDAIVDFTGNLMDIRDSVTQTITFTGLNPNATYKFTGTAIRDEDNPDRITLVAHGTHLRTVAAIRL